MDSDASSDPEIHLSTVASKIMHFARKVAVNNVNATELFRDDLLNAEDLKLLTNEGIDLTDIKIKGRGRSVVFFNRTKSGPTIITDLLMRKEEKVRFDELYAFLLRTLRDCFVQDYWSISLETDRSNISSVVILKDSIAFVMSNLVSGHLGNRISEICTQHGFGSLKHASLDDKNDMYSFDYKVDERSVAAAVEQVLNRSGLDQMTILRVGVL